MTGDIVKTDSTGVRAIAKHAMSIKNRNSETQQASVSHTVPGERADDVAKRKLCDTDHSASAETTVFASKDYRNTHIK